MTTTGMDGERERRRERMTLCTGSVAADKDAPCYKPLLGDSQTTGLCTGKLSFSSFLFPTPTEPRNCIARPGSFCGRGSSRSEEGEGGQRKQP